MPEHIPYHEDDSSVADVLVDKPITAMTMSEYKAWYMEYMKSVPEENIMLISGVPIEIEDNLQAFSDFVTVFQQLKRQGLE